MRIIEGIEELKSLVGQEVAVSEWFRVTQERVNQFADVTEDHQWIHSDPERATAETPFGGTIAHGFLTLSLLSHLTSTSIQVKGDFKMAINYGLNKVRFVSPVPVGSAIQARLVLHAVEEVRGGYQLAWNITVTVENAARPSLVAEWLVRYYL